MSDEDEDVTFEVDLSEALVAAGKALYEASEEFDLLRPYEMLGESDRDGYEGAAGVVLEAALPDVIQQVVDQFAEGAEDDEDEDD